MELIGELAAIIIAVSIIFIGVIIGIEREKSIVLFIIKSAGSIIISAIMISMAAILHMEEKSSRVPVFIECIVLITAGFYILATVFLGVL